MNKGMRSWAFLILVLLLTGFAFAQSSTVQAPQAPAQPSATQKVQVDTVHFESKLMSRTLPYDVFLPPDYNLAEAKSRRYPVLFLLHGLFGHYNNWNEHTKLAHYAMHRSVIIVTPEGNNGWYTDSATVPGDKYEKYIMEELIPDVERRYRAISNRNSRAIAGLSMGGYGSLKFGVKYPEKFFFVASMSGALAAPTWTKVELQGFEAIYRTLPPVFGGEASPTRKENDIFELYSALTTEQIAALPFVYLDCGTEDPLLLYNRDFVELLLRHKIPHEYRQRPGNHGWQYWDAQVQEILALMDKKMRPGTSETAINSR